MSANKPPTPAIRKLPFTKYRFECSCGFHDQWRDEMGEAEEDQRIHGLDAHPEWVITRG